MEGLFEDRNQQESLFQDKKKMDYKKVFKIILVVLLIIILLSGSAYGVFYYITEIKNRDARTDILEIAKNINFDKYTDIDGLSGYFDNINSNSYEFNVGLEANSHDLNNAIKDMTKNEDLNVKDFKIDFNGAVDKKDNKLQTKVDLKHKNTSLVNFEIRDTGEQILLYGDKFFKEHLGVEKDKLKSFMVKEYGLENELAANIGDLSAVSLERNYIREVSTMLNSITKSLPATLEVLTDDNFEINRNLKVNYRNNSLTADTYTIKLTSQQYVNIIERLKTLSKLEANNASIELQTLIGKTDDMVDGMVSYFTQMIGLKLKQSLNINIYKVKNNIVKIEFEKVTPTVEGEEPVENELALEVELVSDKSTNEILISNNELKVKMSITKDNSKVYTKIDIDGKIPIPNSLSLDENPVKEIKDDEEDKDKDEDEDEKESEEDSNAQIIGERNNFAADIFIPEPISSEVENNNSETVGDPDLDTPVSNENPDSNQNQNGGTTTAPTTSTTGTPDIMFEKDDDLLELDETTFTNKIELKANLSFDRPLNNTSAMNFNIAFNSNQVEIIVRADIAIKDEVKIENPTSIIVLTSLDAKSLKSNMKVINETIYSTFMNRLKKEKIIK